MFFEGLFNFFWINFLARGVDAIGATSQQREGAICSDFAPVTGNGVANAIDRFECFRALCFVFVIAKRNRSAAGDKARLIGPWFNLAAIFREDFAMLADLKLCGLNYAVGSGSSISVSGNPSDVTTDKSSGASVRIR